MFTHYSTLTMVPPLDLPPKGMVHIYYNQITGRVEARDWEDNVVEFNGDVSADVVDNLESNSTALALSANQGRVLKGLVDGLDTRIGQAEDDIEAVESSLEDKVDLATEVAKAAYHVNTLEITGDLSALDIPVAFPPLYEDGLQDGRPFYRASSGSSIRCEYQSAFPGWVLFYNGSVWSAFGALATTPDQAVGWTPAVDATGTPAVGLVTPTSAVPGQVVSDTTDDTTLYIKNADGTFSPLPRYSELGTLALRNVDFLSMFGGVGLDSQRQVTRVSGSSTAGDVGASLAELYSALEAVGIIHLVDPA